MTRIELLINLYEKKKRLYTDIRHFRSVEDIHTRQSSIDILIHSTPLKKRNSHNPRYEKLKIENKLLSTKLKIYEQREQDCLSKRSINIENLLDSTSTKSINESTEEKNKNIMLHTLVLLGVMYSTYSDSELETIVHKSNKYQS